MNENNVTTDKIKDTQAAPQKPEREDNDKSTRTATVTKKVRKKPQPDTENTDACNTTTTADTEDQPDTTIPGNDQQAVSSAGANKTMSPDDLQKLPLDEQLWFLIDDVIPQPNHPTEVVIYDMGINQSGTGPAIELFPKSMEIFDEIVNAPNHAMQKYPSMVPYFSTISNLESTYIKRDINPYWEAFPISIPTGIMVTLHIGVTKGARLFLHREPAPGRLPFRLCYGDDSHKHDFVGICYLSMEM